MGIKIALWNQVNVMHFVSHNGQLDTSEFSHKLEIVTYLSPVIVLLQLNRHFVGMGPGGNIESSRPKLVLCKISFKNHPISGHQIHR